MKYLFLFSIAVMMAACHTKEKTIPALTVIIYLEDGAAIDTTRDKRFLERFTHVLKVDFVSKEKAKQVYLEDGNKDWSEVLDGNPLPNAYHVTVNAEEYTLAKLELMKEEIRKRIPYCSDIDYPRSLINKE
jgi:cell division protein FtsX